MSSYSLFFRESDHRHPDGQSQTTKAIFHFSDSDTYQALCREREVQMRIETHGDLSSSTQKLTPLHVFRLKLSDPLRKRASEGRAEAEVHLAEKLDLNVSTRGVVGRQVSLCDADGVLLGTGIIGYN
ncbi:Uncharacterized protein PECH_004037 [Penicillium ucsense]|uniref:Uncharacterized protein n=1 Tax=Penicillium ucsense TaxID=2839758 RepID=A0A8J8WKT0_9EURO|nr:Uncharacterized protein PECM_004717 [Penicillium ucsense]KAF7737338.1 Uncharacterized protein PECH_004037 [Penicillium ucsense]